MTNRTQRFLLAVLFCIGWGVAAHAIQIFPGPQGSPPGATASTQLTDTANIAYLNAANVFSAGGLDIHDTRQGHDDRWVFADDGAGTAAVNVSGGAFVIYSNTGGFFNRSVGDILFQNQTGTFSPMVLNVGAGVSKYQNVTTAGWGMPAIYGSGRATGQTALAAAVASYTVGAADGSFLISANVNVTTATTHSFTVTCTYTDETNTSRTQTLPFCQVAGVPLVTITNITGVGPYEGIPVRIRCKTATAITIQTVGTFTAVVYNVEADITQVK